MRIGFRLHALMIMYVAASLAPLSAQETERWLSTADAAPYRSVSRPLSELARSVVARGIPEKLFLERALEGARKKVPPDRLVSALEAEASRLGYLADIVDGGLLKPSPEERETLLEEGALALRSSFSREEFAAAVESAASVGGDAERIRAVIVAVSVSDPIRAVSAGTRLDLVAALAKSSLRTDRIASLAAVFARGRSYGMSPDRIADVVVAELSAGGSLASVDAALNRSRRTR